MSHFGTHRYANISRTKLDALMAELIAHGSHITGNNPWLIDTKEHGVHLKGEWDVETLTLAITVTGAHWYVTRRALWEKIDSLMG
ncbi:MAG TPA: hypothetical protein VEJ22_02915, partial [Nitrospirota bacterium]|nr:hypothetical protein [Nitrospirota bacterium]